MWKTTTKLTLALATLFLFSAISLAGAQTSNGNPYSVDTNFNPSLAIIIVVLISAFFFMGFFSIYIRQCAGQARTGGSVRRPAIGRSRRGALGLDPAVIEIFPTFLYSDVKGLKIGKCALECAVCLNEFEDDETLRLLPKCDHVFHPECIDAWLASHTTCPVCRANLAPEPGQVDSAAVAGTAFTNVPDSDSGSDDENRASEIDNAQVAIHVVSTDDQNIDNSQPDVINPGQIPGQNRPTRSKSTKRRIAGKFPRSHSTGHSLVQPGENCERFTLRLPVEVRKQIVNGKLSRVKSCVSFPVGDGSNTGGSSRRGYRGGGGGGGEGSSRGRSLQFWRSEQGARSDRWVFSMAPPFFSRTASVTSPKITDAEGSGHGNSRNLFTSVKTPFDCIGSKASSGEESSARPPV